MFNGKCIYRSTYLSIFVISVIPLATGQDQLPQCLQGLILGHLNGGNPVTVTTHPGFFHGKNRWQLVIEPRKIRGFHGIQLDFSIATFVYDSNNYGL